MESLYPNPAQNMVNVKLLKPGYNTLINITDMQGRIVLSKTFSGNTISINTETLKAGMYMVTIQNDNGIVIEKLIIDK